MARKKKVEEVKIEEPVKEEKGNSIMYLALIVMVSIFALVMLGIFDKDVDTSDKYIEPKVLDCNMYNYDFGQDYFIKQDNYFMLDRDNKKMCCVILNRIGTVCDGDCQAACQPVKVK